MLRKICKIGNSQGVSIPKEIMEKLNLTHDSQVDITLNEENQEIIIKPSAIKIKREDINASFADQVNDFIKQYKPALKALSEK